VSAAANWPQPQANRQSETAGGQSAASLGLPREKEERKLDEQGSRARQRSKPSAAAAYRLPVSRRS